MSLIQHQRERALKAVRADIEDLRAELTDDAEMMKVAGWTPKLFAAFVFASGFHSSLPKDFADALGGVLGAEAQFRGLEVPQMAGLILSKALPFATLAATLDGLEYAVEQRLNAAEDAEGIAGVVSWFKANLEGVLAAALAPAA